MLSFNGGLPPQSTTLYEEFIRGASFADAPAQALTSYPEVRSWHDISGGVGRLSDHISVIRRWLRSTAPTRSVMSELIAITVNDRVRWVRSYCLGQTVPVGRLNQIPLFDEKGAP